VSFARRLTSVRILRPLRHRDFALLISGRAVSMSGDGFFIVALAWQVYLIDNDPAALSLVGFAGTVPLLLFLLVGGALTDRYDRRLLMIGADLVRAIAIGTLGVLSIAGVIQLWHIALAEAVVGVASAFFNPASTAIVPDVLPAEDLAQANALSGILRRLTISLIGPAVGGVLHRRLRARSGLPHRRHLIPFFPPRPSLVFALAPPNDTTSTTAFDRRSRT